MPVYVYQDGKGNRVELVKPVNERDNAPGGFKRITVPDRVFVPAGALPPTDMRSNIMKGYYKQECREGSRFKSSYTPKQIKAAWED